MTSVANALSILGREALRIVLPSWCVACERNLPWRERTASCCASCWRALPRITSAKCTSCALPLIGSGDALCIECMIEPLPLDWCDAWGEYRGTLERLLLALKFKRHDFLDDALAGLLEETLREHEDAFDAIVPVPMHRTKERRRGYNQAELLARALSRRTRILCDTSLLAKRVDRGTQSTMSRRERAENVRGAFAASRDVKSKSILLIDDICTTGETLRACARALRKRGAWRVCALSVAKAG